MKQPSMFHKIDMALHFINPSDDHHVEKYDVPMRLIFNAMHKQVTEQRARLPKNDISDVEK